MIDVIKNAFIQSYADSVKGDDVCECVYGFRDKAICLKSKNPHNEVYADRLSRFVFKFDFWKDIIPYLKSGEVNSWLQTQKFNASLYEREEEKSNGDVESRVIILRMLKINNPIMFDLVFNTFVTEKWVEFSESEKFAEALTSLKYITSSPKNTYPQDYILTKILSDYVPFVNVPKAVASIIKSGV